MFFSMFKNILSSSLKGILFAVLCVYAITQFIELSHVIDRDIARNQRPLSGRLSKEVTPSLLASTPVTKLLSLELQNGLLTTQGYSLATRVQAHAETVLAKQFSQKSITNRAQAIEFLSAVGRYLDQHYIYQTKLPLGQGLLLGALDCDMRVFFYLSIAMSLGFDDFYFVLSPGHALVGWQSEQGDALLWETTSRLGAVADLSNRTLYQPVASKRYGDYQLASTNSALLQSQITASTAWVLSREKSPGSLNRALALFDRSLEQFPSANIAAAKVLLGSDNLLIDMPSSSAYADYADTYPYAIGSELYRLSLFLASPNKKDEPLMLTQAYALLQQGVVSPVVQAVLLRYGSFWQKVDGLYLQGMAQNLARILYPSQPFINERDSIAEGRVIILLAAYLSLFVIIFSCTVATFSEFRKSKH